MVKFPSRWLSLVALMLLGLSGVSCKRERVFEVKGIVREVLPQRRQVKIEHEKIPNYMDAMTMPFDVKDARELAGLQPGDRVSFRMIVTDKDGWIDRIVKTGVETTPVRRQKDWRKRADDALFRVPSVSLRKVKIGKMFMPSFG